jgi:hypothetical protein
MADKVQIDQGGIAVVADPTTLVQADQAGVTVVYTQAAAPEVKVAQVGITVVYSDQATEGKTQADQAGMAVVYKDRLDALRQFPALHPKTRWQTQPGKRKFPVVM